MSTKLTITKDDLLMVDTTALTTKQLQIMLGRTPQAYIKSRPAKGGGKWKYVAVGYITKVLNLMFGWDWDFEVISDKIEHGEVVVLGRLTCRSGGKTIIKTQYGNKEIVYKKGTKDPLSIGNDFKAAASDALKKCATALGIAADVYSPDEFKEFDVVDSLPDLTPEHPDWADVKKGVENGTTIAQLKRRYSISEETIKLLGL